MSSCLLIPSFCEKCQEVTVNSTCRSSALCFVWFCLHLSACRAPTGALALHGLWWPVITITIYFINHSGKLKLSFNIMWWPLMAHAAASAPAVASEFWSLSALTLAEMFVFVCAWQPRALRCEKQWQLVLLHEPLLPHANAYTLCTVTDQIVFLSALTTPSPNPLLPFHWFCCCSDSLLSPHTLPSLPCCLHSLLPLMLGLQPLFFCSQFSY